MLEGEVALKRLTSGTDTVADVLFPHFGIMRSKMPQVAPKPFFSRDEVASVYRVGQMRPLQNVFRGLKSKGLVSSGLQVERRDPKTGRVVGRHSLYLSLNTDAVRMARRGFEGEARRLAKAAEQLERSSQVAQLTRAYAEVWSRLGDQAPQSVIWAHLGEDYAPLLARITAAVNRKRKTVTGLAHIGASFCGYVQRVGESFAEVLDSSGDPVALPVAELNDLQLSWVGAPVEVQVEHLGGGRSLVCLYSAVALGNDASDEDDDDDGLPEGRSRLDFARIKVPAGVPSVEQELQHATVALPLTFRGR